MVRKFLLRPSPAPGEPSALFNSARQATARNLGQTGKRLRYFAPTFHLLLLIPMTKRKPKTEPAYQSYFFDVVDWELSYSFSIGGDRKYREEVYWEFLALEIIAKCISPEKFAKDEIQMQILGDRNMDLALNKPDNYNNEPLGIGSLTFRGSRKEYIGFLPQSALENLARSLEAGNSRAINLHGHALRRGTAQITFIGFSNQHDPDNY